MIYKIYKYVIAGNSKTAEEFIKSNEDKLAGVKFVNLNKLSKLSFIDDNDTITLLPGWWGRSWAK